MAGIGARPELTKVLGMVRPAVGATHATALIAANPDLHVRSQPCGFKG
jgi:hypothetical protein